MHLDECIYIYIHKSNSRWLELYIDINFAKCSVIWCDGFAVSVLLGTYIPIDEFISNHLPTIASFIHTDHLDNNYLHRNKIFLDHFTATLREKCFHLKMFIVSRMLPEDIFVLIISKLLIVEKWNMIGISLLDR